jgi:membrane-associated protease RseP (regulator of RpoE activity)
VNSANASLVQPIFLAGLLQALLACAAPHLFQQWDARLKQMAEAPLEKRFYTQQDVSLLLGSPPSKCEQLPSAGPKIGVYLEADQLAIKFVIPGSPAAAAGIEPGFVVRSLNGTATASGQAVLSAVVGAAARVGQPIRIETDHGLFEVSPTEPTLEQCYWNIRSGSVARSAGAASWGGYGGSAAAGSAAYDRFYRATCRFQDGILITVQSNWQM